MKIIGITGGIGSGKSVVCRCLEVMGFPVFYSDQAAKDLFFGDEVQNGLRQIIGLPENEPVSQDFLRKIIFKDEVKLNAVNALIHPMVFDSFDKWVQQHSGFSLLFVESALMLETGLSSMMDKVVCVISPKKLRMNRQIELKGRDEKVVESIINNQSTDEILMAQSDCVILNNENTLLLPQIVNLIAQFK